MYIILILIYVSEILARANLIETFTESTVVSGKGIGDVLLILTFLPLNDLSLKRLGLAEDDIIQIQRCERTSCNVSTVA